MATNAPMIVITINNSTSVKPWPELDEVPGLFMELNLRLDPPTQHLNLNLD